MSNKGGFHKQITLIDVQEIISEDKDVAENLNFENAVKSLEIIGNKEILTSINGVDDPIDISIKKYEIHPSILLIKEKVSLDFQKFSFSLTDLIDMEKEIKSLNPQKVTTLNKVWCEAVLKCKFPNKLKLGDITATHKTGDATRVNNYRAISVLPVISKVFERIMQKQIISYR